VMPPTAPRVRPADVGRFVREVVGDRGEKRQQALRAAVRLADERLQNELDAAKLAAKPMGEIGLTAPVSAVSLSGYRTDQIPTAIDTPMSARSPMNTTGSFPSSVHSTGSHSIGGPPSGDGRASSTGHTPNSQPSITSIASPGLAATNPPPPYENGAASGPARSRKGPLLAGVAGVLVLGVVGVFAATRGGDKGAGNTALAAAPTAAPTVEEKPAVSAVAVATAAPEATADPAGSAVAAAASAPPSFDPSQLPSAEGRDVRPSNNVRTTLAAPPSKGTKDPKDTKDTHKDPPKEKPTGGGSKFVPPPINEPGF
jgi:hypothetical protein